MECRNFFPNHYARFLSDERNFDKAEEQFDIGLRVCEDYLAEDHVQKGVTLLYSLCFIQKGLGTHVMTALLLKDLADFYLFHVYKKNGISRRPSKFH